MDAGQYSALSGALAAQTRLDVIAHNLANLQTPGFKAEVLTQASHRAPGAHPFAHAVHDAITRGTLETDFSQGAISTSGNALDIALSGPGFLVVSGPQGERLTRHGALSLSSDGTLITPAGLKVQGESGDLTLPQSGGAVQIAPDGSIKVGDQLVGKLRLVEVSNLSALVREGGSLFRAPGQALEPARPTDVRVMQGALEDSNYSAVEGMVALTETLRGFEAYAHATQRLDQAASRAITDVGRVI
jgi:flagellar basal body rod protein FlgG